MSGQVVRCSNCGQANRVPELAGGKRAQCGQCHASLPTAASNGKPLVLTDENFAAAIATGATVVDFWAAWCGPCRVLAPVIEELAREQTAVRFAKLDVDANPRTASAYGVQGIPLLVFFRNGKEAGRLVGAVPRTQIEAAIQRYLA